MVEIRVSTRSVPEQPRRSPATLEPLDISNLADAGLQEGEGLDFKREVNLGTDDGKARLIDDVVAFLNRGPARILIGIEEKGGRFAGIRPMPGDPDKAALRLQTIVHNGIAPIPLDVQVVPLLLEDGFILDLQIPRHTSGPYMNRQSGRYLVRTGANNLPIEPDALRSRFVEEASWLARLEELTAAEDAQLAASGRVAAARTLRIGILPREHFDHQRAPFVQEDRVRYPGPVFHPHSDPWFKAAEDGNELYAQDLTPKGIERLYVRDDWFIHASIAFAVQQSRGEGSLALPAFRDGMAGYLKQLASFLAGQAIEGPFAITIALQALGPDRHFHDWFPGVTVVRTLRPRLVGRIDEPEIISDFYHRVKQASRYG